MVWLISINHSKSFIISLLSQRTNKTLLKHRPFWNSIYMDTMNQINWSSAFPWIRIQPLYLLLPLLRIFFPRICKWWFPHFLQFSVQNSFYPWSLLCPLYLKQHSCHFWHFLSLYSALFFSKTKQTKHLFAWFLLSNPNRM